MKLYLLVALAVVVGGLDEEEIGRLDVKAEGFEEDFDEENYVCKRCNEIEHSVGESELEVMSSDENNANDNEKNENSLGESEDIETVFETVEVVADYGNNEINSIEANSEIIEVPVVDIEVSPISLILGDESFSMPDRWQ